MHDLLRGYAAGLTVAEESGPDRRAARTRLLDYYLGAAAAAMDALAPAERHRRPRVPASARRVRGLAGAAGAGAWLDAERATLVAVTGHAAGQGWPGHAIRLASTLFRYLDSGGHFADALVIHGHARGAAQDSGEPSAEAHTLNNLGLVDWRQGRYQQAAGHFETALALFRQAGDYAGEARTLGNLGNVDWQQGRYQAGADHQQHALALYRRLGDRDGEARTLSNLGSGYERQGPPGAAARPPPEALAVGRGPRAPGR